MKNPLLLCTFLLLLIFLPFTSLANPDIPDTLKAWQPWVLAGNEHIQCPFINHSDYAEQKNHVCAWGGPLTLDADQAGASFKQNWQVLATSFIPLAGDQLSWPQQVMVNQKSVPVIERKGVPMLQLEAGNYQIEGQFNWQLMPQNINLPEQTALVKLSVNQQTVAFPKIEGNELWLQQNQILQRQQDEIEVSVARKITDGAHLRLDTYINLSVSGKMREVVLGKVLPQGFALIGIQANLPTFLDTDGLLYVKLKPGDWEVMISAFASPTQLTWQRPKLSHVWPTDEIWVFSSDEQLRSGKISGASSIDNSQATMPDDWQNLPSYLLRADDSLTFEIEHRGMPVQLENQLRLARNLWLAFEQDNFNFVDAITGTMHQDWRISMPAPFNLESAEDADGAVLITTLKQTEKGFETRYSSVNIETRGTVAKSNTLPVAGYVHDFESIALTLHLPPGHDLFAVFGADQVSSSWWSNWSIWSSFIVLLATIASARLISVVAGILTALTLLFIYQQAGAPLITMLNLLLACAVRKHLNFAAITSLVKVYWGLSVTLALGAVLFFAASQLRTVIYPQLEANYAHQVIEKFNDEARYAQEEKNVEKLKSFRAGKISQAQSIESDNLEKVTVTASRMPEKDQFIERYQTDASMQTGSGIPHWQWKSYSINWHSPVAADQQFDLWVLNKSTNRMFKILGVFLALAWLYVLLKTTVETLFKQVQGRTALSLLALGLMLPSYSPPTQAADFPDKILLDELRQRVLAAPDCAPQCATISSLNVHAKGSTLELQFTLQALNATAIALPRSEFWRAEKLQLNGKKLASLYKADAWIYVPLEPGISQLSVTGQLVGAEELQLEFKERPKYISITASEDWQVIGLNKSVLSGNSLTLLNTQAQQQDENQIVSRYNPQPLIKVYRQISFDQTWRITTSVERIAPAQGSISMSVPILEGELVTSSAMTVENKMVKVTIPAGQQSMQWRSTLQRKPALTLQATSNLPIIEHWSLIISPAWHANMHGVPLILEQQSSDDYYAFHFYPYPGEALQLELSRPAAVQGEVIAIDQVNLNIQQGSRTTTLQLDFSFRSTRGGEHNIELPTDFQLKELKIDEQIVNLQTDANRLNLPISPGQHEVKIAMRSNVDHTFRFTSPEFNLHAPVSNLTTTVNINQQRWVLWANGPALGPALLYWGELLTFILLALLLSRLTFSPLSTASWIILGLGLSLNNWGVLMMIVVWFGAISASQYRPNTLSTKHYNAIQVGLYIWSIATVLSLIAIIPMSLLGSPNMGIEGNYSSDNNLIWFADKTQGQLADIVVYSVPVWVYKSLMLVWVIWLSFVLIDWIKWAWQKLGEQAYWKKASIIQTSMTVKDR